MEALTTLDILYITLAFFVTIIWTLLTIVLIRVIKILGPVMEIVGFYNKIKQIFAAYSQIPDMVKEKVWEVLGKDKK
jgi:hypothetical protein